MNCGIRVPLIYKNYSYKGAFYGALGKTARANLIAVLYRDDNFGRGASGLAWEKIGKDSNDTLTNLHDLFIGD